MFGRFFKRTLIPASIVTSSSSFAFCMEDDLKVKTGENVIHTPSFGHTNTRKSFKHHLPNVTLDTITLIAGSAHRSLAEKVSEEIGVPLCKAKVSRFADGEVSVQIDENIRGSDVFIIQTCAAPVNDSIMELLLTISCARRANVQKITAIIPYFGYKHHRRGNSISTKHSSRFLWSGAGDFAAMLQEMGVDRVITVDLQRPGQGLEACFFDNVVPVESIVSTDIFIDYLTQEIPIDQPITVVAPNAECYIKARKYQNLLQKTGRDVKLVPLFASDSSSGPTDVSGLNTLSNQVSYYFYHSIIC
jgi:hypothetical protein